MTDESISPIDGEEDDSRRSFMKKGALASTALAVGATGTAAAQDGDGGLDDSWEALIHISNFYPDAKFTFISGVVEWTPNYGDVNDSWFTDYNTYQIRWLNSGEIASLFVAHDANVGDYDEERGFVPDVDDDENQPQLFQMNRDWSPFGDNQEFIAVNASPVGEEEEDGILEFEDWWQTNDNGNGNGNGSGNGNSSG